MIGKCLGYCLRLLVLFLLGMALLAWMMFLRLRGLDSLDAVEDSIGLSSEWNGRFAVLEKRYPWTSADESGWSAERLDAFVEVKQALVTRLAPLLSPMSPPTPSGGASFVPASHVPAFAVLVQVRGELLRQLEQRKLSLTAYRYFNGVVAQVIQGNTPAAAVAPLALSPEQRLLLSERSEALGKLDTTGLEFLGLPH